MKIEYIGQSKKEFASELSREAQEKFAVDIEMMLMDMPPLSKHKGMKGLGAKVIEMRKNGRPAYRCVYTIRGDTIYILHAFSKTSQDTPKHNQETIKLRYKSVP